MEQWPGHVLNYLMQKGKVCVQVIVLLVAFYFQRQQHVLYLN